MTTLRGVYDGRVVVLSGPSNLRVNQQVLIQVPDEGDAPEPDGLNGAALADLVSRLGFTPADVREMTEAIERDCERIDPDDWNLPFGHQRGGGNSP